MKHTEIASELFSKRYYCYQAVLAAFAEELGMTKEQALKVGACFGGGMCKAEVCGACTGALMALGLKLNPMFGAAAMSLSSFCVVTNALRLNFVKFNKKENKTMKRTLKIEGMMCPHCEANVKKGLEAIDGVENVTPDHKTKTAVVELSKEVPCEVLKKTVEDLGYTVIACDCK